MFYRNTNDSKHNNIRIASLAAGLALATAAVIGGSDLLKDDSSSKSASPATPRVERISPQFGTAADAVHASQGIRASSQFSTMADAVYAVETGALDIDVSAYLGLGQPSVGQSFANMADAVFAVESLYPRTTSVDIDSGNYLGLGQPAEQGSSQPQFGSTADADYMTALETTLIDPTELGSLGIESALQPQFDTTADDDYMTALEATLIDPTELGSLGIESALQPQFGTMADADYASR